MSVATPSADIAEHAAIRELEAPFFDALPHLKMLIQAAARLQSEIKRAKATTCPDGTDLEKVIHGLDLVCAITNMFVPHLDGIEALFSKELTGAQRFRAQVIENLRMNMESFYTTVPIQDLQWLDEVIMRTEGCWQDKSTCLIADIAGRMLGISSQH